MYGWVGRQGCWLAAQLRGLSPLERLAALGGGAGKGAQAAQDTGQDQPSQPLP